MLRGGRATGPRLERADAAFERWRGAHARRRQFARGWPARSTLGGRAKTLARGRHRGAFVFVLGPCAGGEPARQGSVAGDSLLG
jgi:hypothetical protein